MEASLVEASAIDLIGLSACRIGVARASRSLNWTHRFNGTDSNCLSTKPVVVRHKASLLITVNRIYRSNMSNEELYEAIQGYLDSFALVIMQNCVLAVYQRIARVVYRIEKCGASRRTLTPYKTS